MDVLVVIPAVRAQDATVAETERVTRGPSLICYKCVRIQGDLRRRLTRKTPPRRLAPCPFRQTSSPLLGQKRPVLGAQSPRVGFQKALIQQRASKQPQNIQLRENGPWLGLQIPKLLSAKYRRVGIRNGLAPWRVFFGRPGMPAGHPHSEASTGIPGPPHP